MFSERVPKITHHIGCNVSKTPIQVVITLSRVSLLITSERDEGKWVMT